MQPMQLIQPMGLENQTMPEKGLSECFPEPLAARWTLYLQPGTRGISPAEDPDATLLKNHARHRFVRRVIVR